MSRAQRLEKFNSLLLLLGAQPLYAPNEADFKNLALKAYADDMETSMDTVNSTVRTVLEFARLPRRRSLSERQV